MRCLRACLVAALVAVAVACGGGGAPADGTSAACGPIIRERLDPRSALHLLPGAPEPEFLSDPPTSGPHLTGRPPSGVLAEPLDRPTQVLVLELGGVLVQHRDLQDVEIAGLVELAGDQVVVAPNLDLPAPVVATAWLAKRTCDEVDLGALGQFVDEHLGRGPEGGEAGSG